MSQAPTRNALGLPTADAQRRISRSVRVTENLTEEPAKRRRIATDDPGPFLAIYAAEYHDFYALYLWDGVDANRTAGRVVYAWKPSLLRPLAANLYAYTVTIHTIDSITVDDGTTSETWEVRPALRLNYTATRICFSKPLDTAVCSSSLAADLTAAGITIDKIIYDDLNTNGRAWSVSTG